MEAAVPTKCYVSHTRHHSTLTQNTKIYTSTIMAIANLNQNHPSIPNNNILNHTYLAQLTYYLKKRDKTVLRESRAHSTVVIKWLTSKTQPAKYSTK
jgi:hypothetical protein